LDQLIIKAEGSIDNKISIKEGEARVVFYWDQPFLVAWVGCFFVFYWGKPFSLGLIDQLF